MYKFFHLIILTIYSSIVYANQQCLQQTLKELLENPTPIKSYAEMTSGELADEIIRANKQILDYSKNYRPPKEVQLKIDQIYGRNDIGFKEKAKLAYETILDNELKLLPPDSQKRLRVLNDNFKVYKSKDYNGKFSPKTQITVKKIDKDGKEVEATENLPIDEVELNISVQIPEQFQETPIDYALRMHEMLHAIQWEILNNLKVVKERDISPYEMGIFTATSTKGRWFNEAASMAGEWRMIYSTPEEIKKALIAELKNDPNTPEKNKALALRVLSSDAETGRGHIVSEHKAGRYSKQGIVDKKKAEAKLLAGMYIGGPALVAGAFITLISVKNMCLNRVDQHGQFEKTFFFEKVCLAMPGVKGDVIMNINCRRTPGCRIISW